MLSEISQCHKDKYHECFLSDVESRGEKGLDHKRGDY
jgi:hypothetical protein